MPKRKVTHSEMGMAVRELMLKNNYNPLTELMQALKETVPVFDEKGNPVKDHEGKPVRIPMLVHQMGPRDGWREWMAGHKELLNYTQPKLRATETKSSNDYNIHISIQSFDEKRAKVIEMDHKVSRLPEKTNGKTSKDPV